MGAHRLAFWSIENGASSLSAFSALEDAVTGSAAGGGITQPCSIQIAAQRIATGNEPDDIRAQRSKGAEKDLHVVTFGSDGGEGTSILVHRHGNKVLEADGRAKALMDSYLNYKTRAALHLDGSTYNAGDFRISLLRATQRPANRFIGIVIDVEATAFSNSSAASGVLDEVMQLFQEAAAAAVPGAKLAQIVGPYSVYLLPESGCGKLHHGVLLSQLMVHTLAA